MVKKKRMNPTEFGTDTAPQMIKSGKISVLTAAKSGMVSFFLWVRRSVILYEINDVKNDQKKGTKAI